MANTSPWREVGHSRAFYSLIKVGGYPREILDKFQRYHRQSIPDDPIPGPFTERLLVLRSGGTLISSIPSNKYRDRGGSGCLDSAGHSLSGAWRMADYAAVCRVVRLSS